MKMSYPLVIGHRGYRKKFPENTLAAFTAAFNAGIKMIELDVTLTRDRQVVVIHDDTLDRTTSGTGEVMSYDLRDLKKLDAGVWFGSKYKGETIPTLEEVLDLARNRGMVNIEIKKNAYEAHRPEDAIEVQVNEMVKKKNMEKAVLVSSFEPNIIHHLGRLQGAPAIGLITEYFRTEETLKRCLDLNVFSWHPNYRHLTREQVDLMHRHHIRVFPYTVNSKKDYRKLIEMGVDGVFTDDPLVSDGFQ